MDRSLFSYSNYKTYLHDRIRREPKAGHGMRQRLADAMGCQLAYVSQVLRGDRHLSVEQAEALARYLGLSRDEKEYFIWLVEHDRAGSPGSRKFFSELLAQKREQYLQFKKRVDISKEISDQAKARYYGDYLYSAVHMLITIPAYQTSRAISERLQVSAERVTEVLELLKGEGLIQEDRGKLVPTSKYLFLEKTSPFILQHHTNWRLQALRSVARRRPEDQHVSLVVTLGEKDLQSLRRRVAEFLEEVSSTIKASPEERLVNLSLDFFEI